MIDDALVERIRELLAAEPGITEKKMFGGLAFLVDGKMAVAVGGEGRLLARVDRADYDRLVVADGVDDEVMPGRTMRGWLSVDGARLHHSNELAEWVRRGVTVARSMPAKTPRRPRPRAGGH